jgi:hypothetical protein
LSRPGPPFASARPHITIFVMHDAVTGDQRLNARSEQSILFPMSVQDIDRYLLSGIDVHPHAENSIGRHKTSASHSLDRGIASRIPEPSGGLSTRIGRWSEPPSALQELREGKLRPHSQKGQVDLGVSEADIDAVLTSVRHSLKRPTFGNASPFISTVREEELQEPPFPTIISTSTSMQVLESECSTVPKEANYGVVHEKTSQFIPSRPAPDNRVTRAAIWMGVMFTFVFVAAYSMSDNVHAGVQASAIKTTAQQLAAGHSLHLGAKFGPIAHTVAALHKAVSKVTRRAHTESPAAAAISVARSVAADQPSMHKDHHRGHDSDSAIIRAEEKRMAAAVDASNTRLARALAKGGA